MIEAALVVSVIVQGVVVYGFLGYIKHRDRQEQILWNRIQAPATAVMQTTDVEPGSVDYVGEEYYGNGSET